MTYAKEKGELAWYHTEDNRDRSTPKKAERKRSQTPGDVFDGLSHINN